MSRPRLIIAQYSGFCEGVSAAFKKALETAKGQGPVYMLGNLVHNRQVVERLKERGLQVIKDLSDVPPQAPSTLLISAHGVPPEIYQEAKRKGLKIVDTTCAWVKRAQQFARDMARRGLKVIIVGDKGHPEVKGLLGWAGPGAVVVENIDDVGTQNFASQSIGVVAQTTQSEDNLSAIVRVIQGLPLLSVEVHDTICGATEKRQKSAVELAKQVDLMLVIGDVQSANTKRLTELCSKTGTETHQIQTVKELDKSWLTGKTKMGITAGASTPDWVVGEVMGFLEGGAR